MGFLESAGKSGALGQLGQGFLSGAIQTGQFLQQAETNDLNRKLMEMNFQKHAQEEARLSKSIDLSDAMEKARAAGRENETAHFFDFARSVPGVVDVLEGPKGERMERLSMRNFETAQTLYKKFLESDEKQLHVAGWSAVTGAVTRRKMAEDARAALKGNATPAQIAEADSALEKTKKEESEAAGQYQLFKTGKLSETGEQWSAPYALKADGRNVQVQKNIRTGQLRTVVNSPVVNVNTNVNTGLEKGARTKAQEEVQEGTDLYTGLEKVITLARPEYFTYAGQAKAGAEKVGEKIGIVKNPGLLRGFTAWKVAVEQEFNKYRKWVTGVAAGPVELALIRQTFPNKDMSETEFLSAARQTAISTWKLVERRRRALEVGIMDERKQREFYQRTPLDSMPDPPPEIIERFSPIRGIGGPVKTAEDFFLKKGIR